MRRGKIGSFVRGFLDSYGLTKSVAKDFQMADAAGSSPETIETQKLLAETTTGNEGMAYDSDTGQYLPKYLDADGKPTEQAQAQQNATVESPGTVPEGITPSFAGETVKQYRMGEKTQDQPFNADQIAAHRLKSMGEVALKFGEPVQAAQFDALAAERRKTADNQEIRDTLTGSKAGLPHIRPFVNDGAMPPQTAPASNDKPLAPGAAIGLQRATVPTAATQPSNDMAATPGLSRQQSYLDAVGPRVMDAYLRQGKVAEAKAWRDFVESEQGHAYANDFAHAQRLIAAGNFDGAIPALTKLYSSVPDGLNVKTEHLGGGQYRFTMIDEATGQSTGSRVMPASDFGKQAINALSPIKLVEFMAQQNAKRDAERGTADRQIQLENLRQLGQEVREDRRDARTGMQLDAMDRRLTRQIAARETNGGLTLQQQRQNEEIVAAREAVAGLTPEEIRIRTTPTTASGRTNDRYDPQLASMARLAGRRLIGADDTFDQRQGQRSGEDAFAGKPLSDLTDDQLRRFGRHAGADGKAKIDAEQTRRRFAGDAAMQSHALGKPTPKGFEVFDAKGRHVGYYR